jgi:hypothetical protein
MTSSEQNIFWLKWNRFQQRQEKKFTNKFVEALRLQVKAFAKTKDVNTIPSFPIYSVLVDLYKIVGPSWAAYIKTSIKKADGQMGFNENIIALMNQYFGIDLLNDAELMTSYSREIISNVLMNATQQGLSFEQIVKILLVHPEFSRMRAMRISRTEVVTASNTAAQLYAQQSGDNLNKIWISVKDKRTRQDHIAVDGNIVDLNSPFTVGGVQMMHPGVRTQPNGLPVPGNETVNCRCTIAFVGKRDANGRLI